MRKESNRSTTKFIFGIILTMMLLFTAACGSNTNTNNKTNSTGMNTEQSPSTEPSPTEAAVAYPLTIKDDTGTEITFEQAPAKIVTLAPSETEAIYAIGAGEQVVGVDEWSNYPEEAVAKQLVGDVTTNIEVVTGLNPDLVLASSTMNTTAITKLRELKIPVFATDPTTYDAVIAKMESLGQIMNKPAEAAAIAEHMRAAKQQVTDAVKDVEKKKVYLEIDPGYTAGSGTFLDELISLAGGTNVAGGTAGWFEVSAEEIVTQNPQIIIYPSLEASPNPIVAGIESRPGWKVIDALKNKQMFDITTDQLVRVGPRLADGLLELAKTIHPDLFK